ncbi:MAG: Flp pilus assembly protein TadD [Halioglobus sp.]|jgi:Flp pilus assembly protein TadD
MGSTSLSLAEAAHQRGDLVAAKQLYSRALREDDNSAGALYGLGTIALQQKDSDIARELLAKASAIQPQAADIAFNYAVCLERAGEHGLAVTEALRAAELAATDEDFSNTICQLLLKLDQAKVVLQLKSKHQHQRSSSRILAAKAYGFLGEWDKAVSLLRALSAAHANDSKICRELSIAAGRLRDYPLAIDSYRRYLALITPQAHDYLKLADLYLIARDLDNSTEQLSLAASSGACGADYQILKARLERLNGENRLACLSSEEALDLQPGNVQAWKIRIETADTEELRDLIPRINTKVDFAAISQHEKVTIHYALADAYLRLGEQAEAFAKLKTANGLQKSILQSKQADYSFTQSQFKTDSTIEHFQKIFSHANAIPDEPTPIFIVGMPRSGTTLMERLLSQVEDVTAGGEIEVMGFLATQYRMDVNNRRSPLPASMTSVQWEEIARQYYARTPSSKQYLVDKLPHNFNHVGMILSLFPEARILQMRRDPRDVCLSIYSHSFSEGHSYAIDFDAMAHTFKLSRQLMDHWAQLAPDRVLNVNYESLAANPLVEGRKAVEFCGLEWSDRCLDFYKNPGASFTFSEMQVREAISKKRVGRWKEYEEELGGMFAALTKYGLL